MNLIARINWIKNHIKLRLPGGAVYERVKDLTFNKKEILEDELKVFYYWLHRYESIYKIVYKGAKFSEGELDIFYNWLNQNYLSEDKTHYIIVVDAVPIKIPIPNIPNRLSYQWQIFDLIFSYKLGYPELTVPFLEGPYEYGSIKVKAGDVVLDVGANYGLFSAYASSKGATTYAFEPIPELCNNQLKLVADLNPGINIIQKALCDKVGEELFRIEEDHFGESMLTNEKENATLVETDTLDNFCKNFNKLDFIKGDIEGSELRLLEGGRRVIKEFKPKIVLCNYHHFWDSRRIANLIKSIEPSYVIEHKWLKTYAHSPKEVDTQVKTPKFTNSSNQRLTKSHAFISKKSS